MKMTPGDLWNWTWAVLGILLLYSIATSAALHSIDAPKIAFGFAGISSAFQTVMVSVVLLSLYGAFTKRWYPLTSIFLALLLLIPSVVVFVIITGISDYVWFSLLHLPQPSRRLYFAWGILPPVALLVLAILRKPNEEQPQQERQQKSRAYR